MQSLLLVLPKVRDSVIADENEYCTDSGPLHRYDLSNLRIQSHTAYNNTSSSIFRIVPCDTTTSVFI